MKTIWKFPLSVTSIQEVPMPFEAEILSAQLQGDALCLWALVNPDNVTKLRTIEIYGTGHDIPEGRREFIGTVQPGPLVFHVFERLDRVREQSK